MIRKEAYRWRPARPDVSDPPFACPPDIVLDLPVPPSVNRLRKVDWNGSRKAKKWRLAADKFVLAARCRSRNPIKFQMLDRFEVLIVFSEDHTGMDLDNGVKATVDYLRLIELIHDDGPKHMRRLVVEWGHAPEGCRVTVRPVA